MSDISSGAYVIDEDYTIVSFNDTIKGLYPQLEVGEKCYKCLMGLDEPCPPCPVANRIFGPRTYMDPIRGIYETVDAVELVLGDGRRGHALVESTVGESEVIAAKLPRTDEELRKLREHGLALVYIGLESGNEDLLLKFNKGVTAAETVKNALRCKAAGIAISVTAINGMAGLNGDWQAHAIDTAKAVSAMKPEFIAFLTLRVYSGTPLHDWIEAGEFQMMGPVDLMRETRLFLEHIDSEGSVFRSNHASNYLPLGGTLNRDREALIQTIDAALDGKVRLRRAVELGL